MARKNRVSVYDGIYHVTSRIANRAMLLADEGVKDEILERDSAASNSGRSASWTTISTSSSASRPFRRNTG